MARWEDQAKSGFDYNDRDWKFVLDARAFYERRFDKISPESERPVDVCKAMLAVVNRLWQNHTAVLRSFFDDDEFRRFCQLHGRFGTGVENSRYHQPDVFEKAVGEWLMPRPGDFEAAYPDPPEGVLRLINIWGKSDLEVLPQCIFIPGAVVTFDINRRNEWNGFGDVAVADGISLDWPDDCDAKIVIHDVIQYLKGQPTVAV